MSKRTTGALAALATVALLASTVISSGGASAAPGGDIVGAGDANAIAGSYIVVMKKGEAAPKVNGKVDRKMAAVGAMEISTSVSEAKRLAGLDSVALVEQNRTLKIQDEIKSSTVQPFPTWGLDRIDEKQLPMDRRYEYPSHGGLGSTTYVIDTGVRITHTQFGSPSRAVYGYDFVDNDPIAQDCHGHGTHVAGTVAGVTYGVAKRSKIVAVRVLDCAGSGTYAGVIAGVNYVTTVSPARSSANMSLGGGLSPALNAAVAASVASGVPYAVAAGNSNDNACSYSPAATPTAVTVGSTDATDFRSSFSNYGPCLDLFAPGRNITSAWNTSNTAVNTISGTSMATPHVAGAMALAFNERPSMTSAQMTTYLTTFATPWRVIGEGPGSPDLILTVYTPNV